MHRHFPKLLAGMAAAAIAVAACGDTGGKKGDTSAAASTAGSGSPVTTAPESARVDVAEPTFSDPTNITNPLFPITEVTHVIQLGKEGKVALRHEVTLLPETKTIEWNGQQVETIVSQFVAYGDGRILETAVDFFAQADDGSVWYFGEDVFNYENGVVANTDGTWLAGKDGPPGMIMPADPQVGDVYRPENIPGFVFEEVTVKSVDETVNGPRGPVEGAVVVKEALMDGTLEDKTFAPGYGEFQAVVVTAKELVTAALAVPTDTLPEPAPAELGTISSSAVAVLEAAQSEDWSAAQVSGDTVSTAWDTYRRGDVPELLAQQMSDALDALTGAVADKDAAGTSQAALDVGLASLDLQLRHRPQAEIDVARLGLLAHQVIVDAQADDSGAVAGDVVVLETIWDRVRNAVTDSSAAQQVQTALDDLNNAAEAGDTQAAAAAARILDLVDALEGTY